MTSQQVRDKYLTFFKDRGHVVIPPAPLVLENDPTTLFTSSGMQPLVPFLMGQHHPMGKRLADSQPSIRVQDIDEVGDNRHTTFFEMLGNWSLGDYFKAQQLPWIFEFVTSKEKGLGLDPKRLYVSVFEGMGSVPKDEESISIWKAEFNKVGIDAQVGERIFTYPAKKNWWSRSGTPEQMPSGEIGGPDSEVFFDFGQELGFHEQSVWKNEQCHPNCDCGRFMEIANSVFIQYVKKDDGTLEELPQKNVDFGGGLERMVAATNGNPDIFNIDVFSNLTPSIEKQVGKKYSDDPYSFRIILDHIRAAVFLANSGVIPSNKAQGYIMRRLIRRAVLKARTLKNGVIEPNIFVNLAGDCVDQYGNIYFDSDSKQLIKSVIFDEVNRFYTTLERGYAQVKKLNTISGDGAFDLYQTFGFPLEITIELFREKGQEIDVVDAFKKAYDAHQQQSRTASAGMFKGGLGGHSETEIKYHTATHLLHKALREVLGDEVHQAGSNITAERLRFDFTYPAKLTDDQKSKIEDIINEKISQDLAVTKIEMDKSIALSEGALAFFPEKYPAITSVYIIGPVDNWYSKELCGGPHVSHTGEIGRVKIIKEESASAGVRRIYAKLA